MIRAIAIAICQLLPLTTQGQVKNLILSPGEEMLRAELYIWHPTNDVQAVMVFCPGHNGSGESFVNTPKWQRYAEQNKLLLCGLSFASDMAITKESRGYSYADRGSGELLVAALRKYLGGRDYPIILYGYSAGARFATSFLLWKPEQVLTWCASGVGTWPEICEKKGASVPGIVACGEYDAVCYWNSLHYFQLGRGKGYPWTWISLPDIGHSYSSQLDEFVAKYFSYIILEYTSEKKHGNSTFMDISTRAMVSPRDLNFDPIFSSWLPNDAVIIKNWTELHAP